MSVVAHMLIYVFVIGDGEVFGDYALMNDTELECSYITAIPCELIILSGFNVRKLISNE